MNSIKSVFGLFERIGSTTSRTEKELIIKEGSTNDHFKTLLNFTYNPYDKFYIKKLPKVKLDESEVSEEKYEEFIQVLLELITRQITGNAAIERAKSFFEKCNETEYKWYGKVLQKDLKIGITSKTINKVIPNLIPTFNCMLAHPLKNLPDKFIIEPKLDGYRCLAFNYGHGRVELMTRNGRLIEGYGQIEKEISEKLEAGFVYDGEIMSRSGTFSDVQKSAFKKGKNKDGALFIFDCVPIEEFMLGKSSAKLLDRKDHLLSMFRGIKTGHIAPIIGSHIMRDMDEAMAEHKKFVQEGYEGTMVKDIAFVYECKRSYAVQKIKDMETLDLVVVGVEEGEEGTKFEGTLGALIVDFKGNQVRVGSGYTESQRKEFWAIKEDIINRVVEVKYQEISKNKDGKESLRFPIFQRIREDKE